MFRGKRGGRDWFWGALLLVLGALWLLKNLEVIKGDIWPYILPAILILIGLKLIIQRARPDDEEIKKK